LDRAAAEPALAGAMERKIRAFVKQRTGVGRPRQPLTAAERALLGNVGYLTPSNRPTATRSASRPPDQRDTGG
jgi:hypothetical protein